MDNYCKKCGCYIPIDEDNCVACGYPVNFTLKNNIVSISEYNTNKSYFQNNNKLQTWEIRGGIGNPIICYICNE